MLDDIGGGVMILENVSCERWVDDDRCRALTTFGSGGFEVVHLGSLDLITGIAEVSLIFVVHLHKIGFGFVDSWVDSPIGAIEVSWG